MAELKQEAEQKGPYGLVQVPSNLESELAWRSGLYIYIAVYYQLKDLINSVTS